MAKISRRSAFVWDSEDQVEMGPPPTEEERRAAEKRIEEIRQTQRREQELKDGKA